MSGFLRILGIGAVYMITMVAWLVLGGVTQGRSHDQSDKLDDSVSSLWGAPQSQTAPELTFFVKKTPEELAAEAARRPLQQQVVVRPDGTQEVVAAAPPAIEDPGVSVPLSSSTIDVAIDSDPRRKGLVWFSLYDVHFQGIYKYKHTAERDGRVRIRLALPNTTAIYDDLAFDVDGVDRRAELNPVTGAFETFIDVKKGQEIAFRAGYQTRGSDDWSYRPAAGVQRLENFTLNMRTNFRDIDFPNQTLSPSTKAPTEDGWKLSWLFESTITGHGIGMTMPQHIQPGELSSALSFSAPVSLLFFFVVLFILATLRKIDIHPINYLFISAAFFAFHLLFSYSVDHLSVPVAFAIASVVSMGLVTSYLRLVISARFALREAALAQLVYLIGFSLAHFWDGFTGLTITVLAILTLFLLMQATGRIRWSEVFERNSPPRRPEQRPVEPEIGPEPAV